MSMCVAASMAEICSSYPTSTSILSPLLLSHEKVFIFFFAVAWVIGTWGRNIYTTRRERERRFVKPFLLRAIFDMFYLRERRGQWVDQTSKPSKGRGQREGPMHTRKLYFPLDFLILVQLYTGDTPPYLFSDWLTDFFSLLSFFLPAGLVHFFLSFCFN
jgi:hypothetical protein